MAKIIKESGIARKPPAYQQRIHVSLYLNNSTRCLQQSCVLKPTLFTGNYTGVWILSVEHVKYCIVSYEFTSMEAANRIGVIPFGAAHQRLILLHVEEIGVR